MSATQDGDREVDEESNLLDRGQENIKRLYGGFVDFAMQGNIIEIAFGLIVANVFTVLVKEFVTDILMPPLSLLLPIQRNMQERFLVLHPGPNFNSTVGYNTVTLAQEDGAVILAWGSFVNAVAQFLGVGLALYVITLIYVWLSKDPIIKHMVKCPYCRKNISEKVSKELF